MATDITDMLLEEQLTYAVRGAFIAVSARYGPGHKERVYQVACEEELQRLTIAFVAHPRVHIHSLDSGERIAEYIPDLVIAERIVVELKAVPVLSIVAETQLAMYLRATMYEIGMLVNFGTSKARIIRQIYTNDRKPWFTAIGGAVQSTSV